MFFSWVDVIYIIAYIHCIVYIYIDIDRERERETIYTVYIAYVHCVFFFIYLCILFGIKCCIPIADNIFP